MLDYLPWIIGPLVGLLFCWMMAPARKKSREYAHILPAPWKAPPPLILLPVRTYKDGDRLTVFETEIFMTATCPDCKQKKLLGGPEGGLSKNYMCDDDDCGSKFNEMGPFGVERISDRSPKKQMEEKTHAYR